MLDGVTKLHCALNQITAAISSDVAIDNHSVHPIIVGFGVSISTHLEEASAFRGTLTMCDQIVEVGDGAFATPCFQRFFGQTRHDECFESCYMMATRTTFLVLA